MIWRMTGQYAGGITGNMIKFIGVEVTDDVEESKCGPQAGKGEKNAGNYLPGVDLVSVDKLHKGQQVVSSGWYDKECCQSGEKKPGNGFFESRHRVAPLS